jgi:hypothetical protein
VRAIQQHTGADSSAGPSASTHDRELLLQAAQHMRQLAAALLRDADSEADAQLPA